LAFKLQNQPAFLFLKLIASRQRDFFAADFAERQ